MRIVSFDYFRGVAILFIVAGHSYGPWAIDSFWERVAANLISGGTALFVFISGFFFHYVFYKNFHLGKFLAKKTRNVFIPYLLLTLIGLSYFLALSEPLPWIDIMGIDHPEFHYSEMVLKYLWTGRIAITYWYIPFILIIFLLSPLFIRYIELSRKYRIYILIILLISSMFIHRPAGNLSPLHSVIYFIPIYMLGIICSIYRVEVIDFIKGKSIGLGLIVLLLSALQALLFENYGNFHKDEIFSYGGIDIIIIQKIFMCFFFLSLLQNCEDVNIPILKMLASSSFAIFFIHPWMLLFFNKTGVLAFFQFLPEIVIFLLTALSVLTGSLLVAYLMKYALKRNSRYIIGW